MGQKPETREEMIYMNLLLIIMTSGINGQSHGEGDNSRGQCPVVNQPPANGSGEEKVLTCESPSVEAKPGKNVTVTCTTTQDLRAATLEVFHNISGSCKEIMTYHQEQTRFGQNEEFKDQVFFKHQHPQEFSLTLSPELAQKGGRILFSIIDRLPYTCAVDIVDPPRGGSNTPNWNWPQDLTVGSTTTADHKHFIYIGAVVGVLILFLCVILAIPKSRQFICGKCGKTEEPPNNGPNDRQEMNQLI